MVLVRKATSNEDFVNKYKTFLTKLKIDFKDIDRYILAFVHRSVVNERPDFTPEHNERLEFLWDAVLELSVTNKLFLDFPNKTEWELTDIRSAIVRWRNLAIVAKNLDFSKYLILGNWERMSWWDKNDYILANTLEAFIWALYLDLWFKEAEFFIIKYIYSNIDIILDKKLFKDYKSMIQELVQAQFDVTPSYKVLNEEWPDHSKIFTVWIFMWEKIIWEWTWSSKKKWEEKAAEDAYIKLTS